MTKGKDEILQSLKDVTNQNVIIIDILNETRSLLKALENRLETINNDTISIDTYSDIKSPATLISDVDIITNINNNNDEVCITFSTTNNHIIHPRNTIKKTKQVLKKEKYQQIINKIYNHQIDHFHFDSIIVSLNKNNINVYLFSHCLP